MSHTAGELKAVIAGFLHRDPQVFVRPARTGAVGYLTDENGNQITGEDGSPIVVALPSVGEVDVLLNAMNNARLYAERRIDFELARVSIDIPNVSLTDGGSLANAVLHSDGVTSVSVKKLTTVFLATTSGGYYPIDLWGKRKWNLRLKSYYERVSPSDLPQVDAFSGMPLTAVQQGSTIFISPANSDVLSSTFTVYADAVSWLDNYVDGSETDFLLNYAFDWLMYRSIFELNFYLKEDERVQLSSSLMKEAWDAMVIWNNELLAANVDTTDLD